MRVAVLVVVPWLCLSADVVRADDMTAIDIRQLPKALSQVLKITPDCSPLDNVIMERSGVTRFMLPGGVEFYRVPCWANDRNTVERYFTIDQAGASPLLFATYSERTGWTGTAEMLNSRFDPATLEIAAHGKADGSGTCGRSGRWRWRDGAFRMIELRYQPGCDSGGASDPAQWPVIYKAKEE